jgi:hypothetical protein
MPAFTAAHLSAALYKPVAGSEAESRRAAMVTKCIHESGRSGSSSAASMRAMTRARSRAPKRPRTYTYWDASRL